ncbi:hypothetical protein [Pseudosulfitobacter pseudonitzschiae]|uniref:hypothetical protein n=1 Tax=Pseudosulfitobacter pseudonitzschiae TaxID=1402135 RepID=UPI001AF802DC|nr:hypothetical protein [Pseudosulfitobacter pseudonitzschiae]MBM1815292.1 hypothetical protein [Pseudosulfitobacter pseudonitzschiae]MBM1832283.1 hypothetical protein [Pseudosulfitobacter pseudonitzschiae]MBM1837151.1 hypothetical protein [Pseudosulfitobacter pseudonitzschiae]MBM1841997.1 hypothetical protein [Pseudosulfitobacter pseudonitzschiae]MBM1846865.1 hypothetical protein [Pseudosulfitobacter pseudonitzschiae]
MRDHSTDTDARIPSIGAAVAKAPNTITGFDAAEDVLLIEVPPGVDATITGQRVTPAGLWLTFSTGEAVLLEGLDAMIPEDAVTFVETDANEAATGTHAALFPNEAPGGHITGAVTLGGFDVDADCIVIATDSPGKLSVLAQAVTDQGLTITLSNGVTVTLSDVTQPLDDGDVVFVPTGAKLP